MGGVDAGKKRLDMTCQLRLSPERIDLGLEDDETQRRRAVRLGSG